MGTNGERRTREVKLSMHRAANRKYREKDIKKQEKVERERDCKENKIKLANIYRNMIDGYLKGNRKSKTQREMSIRVPKFKK